MKSEVQYYLKQQVQMGFIVLLEETLKYSKEKWLAQGIPKNAIISEDPNDKTFNVEVTVLDQSCFLPHE